MKKIIITLGIIAIALISFIILFTPTRKIQALWINWGKNQTCNPRAIYKPATKEELKTIIKDANSKNHKLRPYGASHSWSKIVCSDYLVDTQKLNKILSIDKNKNLVQVEAGIKIYELNKLLNKAGLALPNQSFTQAQTIVGNIATATHGTGQTGTFSNFIKALEIVTADGTVQNICLENNPKLFKAAATHLGSLGIVYSVIIQCVPSFKVKHHRILTDWDSLKNQYQELLKKHDYFQFFWNPYTDKALTYTWDKTDEEITTFSNYLLKLKDKLFVGRWTGEFWVKFLDLFPTINPIFINIYQWLAATSNHVDYSYNLMTAAEKSDEEVMYEEEEIAVSINDLPQALHDLKELLEKYKKEAFYPLFWGVLIRFTETDNNSYISMSSGEKKAYISITSAHINNGFYKEFQDRMMKYKGRPHWGKINFLDYEKAKKLYGKNLDDFIAIRKELDPQDMFANSYIKRVFNKPN